MLAPRCASSARAAGRGKARAPRRYTSPVLNIGPLEFLVIAVLALVILGPERLPDAARQLGKINTAHYKQALVYRDQARRETAGHPGERVQLSRAGQRAAREQQGNRRQR